MHFIYCLLSVRLVIGITNAVEFFILPLCSCAVIFPDRRLDESAHDRGIGGVFDEGDSLAARLEALMAADCAERVLQHFEIEFPKDDCPRKAFEALISAPA